jgi:hypothetical protein
MEIDVECSLLEYENTSSLEEIGNAKQRIAWYISS